MTTQIIKSDSSLELTLTKTKTELICWIVGMGLLQITIIASLIFKLTGKI